METIHPITVHFPIALVLTATLVSVLSLLIKAKRNELMIVLYWIMLIGSVSLLAALFSGLYESGKLVHNETIHEILETHELLGYIISASFILLTLWVLFRNRRLQVRELYFITALLVATSTVLFYSAYLGGRMVYEEGAGVKPMEKIIEQMHGGTGHDHGGTMMLDKEESKHAHDAEEQKHDKAPVHNHKTTNEHSDNVDGHSH